MIAVYQKKGGKDHKIKGMTVDSCAKNLLTFRLTNSLPGATLAECLSFVNRNAFRDKPKLQNQAPQKMLHKLSIAKVIAGSKAIADIVVRGDVVDDQELTRRASICAQCPLISDTQDNCVGCAARKLNRFANFLALKFGQNFREPVINTKVNGRSKGGRLSEFYCGHCGCSCLTLCLSKSKHFLSKENKERPVNCWARKP